MALITTGLTNGGITPHYNFSYEDSFANSPTDPAGPEPARTNAVITACENDYNLMSGWFGGSDVTGMNVQVTTIALNTCDDRDDFGACWTGFPNSSTIQVKADQPSYSNNPVYLRYLLVLEVTEIFMMAQGIGGGWWAQHPDGSGDEGSKGEGLSRFLSGQFLEQNSFLDIGILNNFGIANLWLNSPRLDFVNTAPEDSGYNAINGCTTLFIYYLFHQLGFTINQIVANGASTLAGVYRNLTGDLASDPFQSLKQLLDNAFPGTTTNPGMNPDDPFPLG